MIPFWKHCSGQAELLILFNGWGCDETLYEKIDPGRRDFLILSNYTQTDDVDFSFIHDYCRSTVLAWSFGVYVASSLTRHRIKCTHAIAVNGTPYPVDDQYGIPESIFHGTLNSYDENSRIKFERRMIGRSRRFIPNNGQLSQRTTESQFHELAALAKQLDKTSKPDVINHSFWSLALISDRDRIFPPGNMKRYWEEKGIPISGDHLPDFQMIIDRFCSG